MTTLPPYSTYRTDNKQMMYPQAVSHGNVLSFTPPGFKQTLNVKFPDCRLAVCEKCKKNYKTRDMCRVRNNHSEAPWSTAFICITLDESCTDADGKYVDKPYTVRMVQWQPFCVKEPFDHKTPVCAACKKTNRTRSFCRERHQHRQLPWCTVYVILSALDKTDPSTVVAAPSQPLDGVVKKEDNVKKEDVEGKEGEAEKEGDSPEEKKEPSSPKDSSETNATPNSTPSSSQKSTANTPSTPQDNEKGDDINAIDESRTFLAKVSCKSITIHWLELAEYDGTTATMPGVNTESNVQALNAAIRNPTMSNVGSMDASQYYASMGAMGYAHHQQHQQALKIQQQHFLQMQQRQQQHFAAQQAAWQAQYNQQMQMQVAATGNAASAAPSMMIQPAPAVGVPAPGQQQQPPQPSPSSSKPSNSKNSNKSQQNGAPNPSSSTTPHIKNDDSSSANQQNTTAAIAAQQQAQWQAHMMYQQQLYHQQISLQQQQQQQQQNRQPGMPMMAHPTGPVMIQPSMVQSTGLMPGMPMPQQGGQQGQAAPSPGMLMMPQQGQVSAMGMTQGVGGGDNKQGRRGDGGGEPKVKRQCV